MPQLSPMSWVLVFGVLLVCVILFMVSVWWGVVGEYKITGKNKVGGIVGGAKGLSVKWGFGKKFGLNSQK
uniref:ATP synthase F0 subunit 8 n=1 Tax=Potamilus leptodon TaxID=301916 RepID=A0A0S1VVG6_9BIVA|nr:ATP synthase F0 subunit 8 [Potamilus leptodon]ALM54905.1 ATP synthase F0 subunit 8 [Potamilus leptodon]